MTCTNCFHYGLCSSIGYRNINRKDVDINCEFFKDKSKVIELPCKIGTKVFILRNDVKQVVKCEVIGIGILEFIKMAKFFIIYNERNCCRYSIYDFEDLGKTVFFTREEAEEALKKQEEKS